jgi:asparagine synthase (glutamine-hydrolysing)
MCGITGIIKYSGIIEKSEVKTMCDRLSLRGPDAEGFFINKNIGLGHRRLSIIDLETGDQPMFSADKSVVVVFNGEIYNFRELRNELEAKGYTFATTSDTEVLINGYLAFGLETILNRLEGMFAFALYDTKLEKLFVARDKFGEKPLYYSNNEESFTFASELKAFNPKLNTHEIDIKALNYFLTLTYIPAPYTIYKDIHKLKAGCYLTIDNQGVLSTNMYFELSSQISRLQPISNFVDAKKRVEETVTKSISSRMVSDVPLGAFLSGGIDSSIVAVIMSKLSEKPINTFTIGFHEKAYDESKRAELIAKHINSNHTVHFLDYKDVVNMVDEIILHYDEPFGDSSALPSYYVAKLAREKVKVVLTGDCADELFGGYEKYLGRYYADKFKKLPALLQTLVKKAVFNLPHNRLTNVILRKVKKVISNAEMSDFDLHYNLMSLGYNDKERSGLLNSMWYAEIKHEIEKIYNSYPGKTSLEKSQHADIKIVLEGDMFVKTDRVCMKNSLESRAPFIDSNIIDTVFRIPSDFKIKGRNKKYILKETFRHLLPAETLSYRKKGFGVPVDYWFKNELKGELEALIDRELIEKQGIFNYSNVKRLFDEHQSGKENHKSKLWNLYVFQKWYLAHN